MPDPSTDKPVHDNLFREDLGDGKKKRGRRSNPDSLLVSERGMAYGNPPNLGKALKVKVPDFLDPNRPKTCLEIDFPIVPINALSALEGNAGKPIYQMSKWWARRRSCIFRALLIAAGMEAPIRRHTDGQPMLGPEGTPIIDDEAADKLVWDAYYANHQAAGSFKHLKVLDPFMGGGTTVVEGSRLGFQVTGVDLNPVAWFIVKNELACTDPRAVQALFDAIEAEVKPQIQPYYVTDQVGGMKGRWSRIETTDKHGSASQAIPMPADFDPCSLPAAERKSYLYDGPEVIYTFWAKHGPCSQPGCGHRTPIFRSPIVATKKLGVKYIRCTCKSKQCAITFDAELGNARIAPEAEHVVLDTECPYAVLTHGFATRLLSYAEGDKSERMLRIQELLEMVEGETGFRCPKCDTWSGQTVRDVLAMHLRATRLADIDKKHLGILPHRNSKKPIYCTLLIDPDWLKGSRGANGNTELGGFVGAPIEATEAWYRERLDALRLLEVRGNRSSAEESDIPQSVDSEAPEEGEPRSWLPDTVTTLSGRVINTKAETIARKANGKEWDSHFLCAACGTQQDFRLCVQRTRRTAPVAPYAIQAYDPAREAEGEAYGGRYFKVPSGTDMDRLVAAEREWETRKDTDLRDSWPREELPQTYMTHQANFALPEQGYTHWYKMFNPRQLMTHAALLKAVVSSPFDEAVRLQGLGAIQQYLRYQNMFSIWNIARDHFAAFFGNANYAPKHNTVEVGLWVKGYGSWPSAIAAVIEAAKWSECPTDWYQPAGPGAKSEAVRPGDRLIPGTNLMCGSSSELTAILDRSVDVVVTDPPFGDNLYYSDLANFFYAWLRLPLKDKYPDLFGPTKTPNAQEALKPRWLADADGDQYYYERLTPCWAESCRVMKDGGLLAFTFHHSEDSQWEIVLKSLFEAGLYLEATYPIASDEMKGKGGQFGAKGTEYDIIHVCRKRLEAPRPVSWPKMRQWVKAELSRLRPLLESFKSRGLSDADIRVILRGKALEFYSRHYGRVLISAPGGEETVLSIRDALLGINQLLDESSGDPGDRPPSLVQPVVYQYLRLFGFKAALSRDEVGKMLRGTAIQQRDFEQAGWISEEDKVVRRVLIYDRFQAMRMRSRRELKTELDQAQFLIGAAMKPKEGDAGVNVQKEFERDTFLVRPGVDALLDWFAKRPAEGDEPGVSQAAALALTLLRAAFEAKRAKIRHEQPLLWEEWEATGLDVVR